MRKCHPILAILLPLAVMAAQAGTSLFSVPDLLAQSGGLSAKGSPSDPADSDRSFQKNLGASIFMAHSGADWPDKPVKKTGNGSDQDSMKSGTAGKAKDVKNDDSEEESDSVDDEGEEGENEEDEEDDKDKDGGGWDRLWDAPKLG